MTTATQRLAHPSLSTPIAGDDFEFFVPPAAELAASNGSGSECEDVNIDSSDHEGNGNGHSDDELAGMFGDDTDRLIDDLLSLGTDAADSDSETPPEGDATTIADSASETDGQPAGASETAQAGQSAPSATSAPESLPSPADSHIADSPPAAADSPGTTKQSESATEKVDGAAAVQPGGEQGQARLIAPPVPLSTYTQFLRDYDEWNERRREAEHNLCTVALKLSEYQDRIKTLRETLKDLTEQLATINADEPQWPPANVQTKLAGIERPEPAERGTSEPRQSDVSAQSGGVTGPASSTPTNAAPDVPPLSPDAWRHAPISQLSLKPALEAKLLENGIETIGQLEDLRAKGAAGGAGVGLRSIKGVGQAKADAIEDAIIGWLSRNRDQQIFERAAGGGHIPPIGNAPVCGAATPDSELPPPAQDNPTDGASEPPEGPPAAAVETAGKPKKKRAKQPPALSTATPAVIAAADPDAARAVAIERLAAEIASAAKQSAATTNSDAKLTGTGQPNATWEDFLTPHLDDHGPYNSGINAADNGDRLIDCPWMEGTGEESDWIRGWLLSRAVSEVAG